MCFLAWKPVMLGEDINFFPVGQQLEPLKIRMTMEADIVVIKYCLLNVFAVPDTYFITVGIMTIPAGKTFLFKLKMNTYFVALFYSLKIVLCEVLISSMTIDTIVTLLHTQFTLMREIYIFLRMAVSATEALVIGIVEFAPVHYPFRKHRGFNYPAKDFICILVA
jgi:hypothetical protein